MKGLERGGVVDKTGRFLESASRAALYLYGKADSLNRYMSIQLAQNITDDLLDGKTYAQAWLKRADPALKADVARLVQIAKRASDPQQVQQLKQTLEYTVAGYMISKTQFHYTKAESFRLGRMLGPLFTTFTKFPNMVGSDVVEGFQQGRGWQNLAQKYIAPLAAVAAVHNVLADEDSPRGQALLLKDSWKLSPLSATMEVKTPPVIGTAKDLGVGLLSAFTGDLDKLEAAGKSIATTYIPFQWLPKAQDEITTLITGSNPTP
jgi:hypothetical protein